MKYKFAGKSAKKSVVMISIVLGVFALAGCLSGTTMALTSIQGVSAAGIFLHVPDDGGPVIITGHVDESFEKRLIEKHVRFNLGHERISNRITFD